jgi:hypothetical protein
VDDAHIETSMRLAHSPLLCCNHNFVPHILEGFACIHTAAAAAAAALLSVIWHTVSLIDSYSSHVHTVPLHCCQHAASFVQNGPRQFHSDACASPCCTHLAEPHLCRGLHSTAKHTARLQSTVSCEAWLQQQLPNLGTCIANDAEC